MKPSRFEYLAPQTLPEAVAALAEHHEDAAVLAGGQSLLAMMNLRIAAPAVLIDIMRIPELRQMRRTDGRTEIGAGIRMAQAERESGIPLLVRALGYVGHTAIRNSGTICGSVAHADPSAEVPGALLALDAEVVLESQRGRRVLAADEFFRSHFETARAPDELIVAVRIPDASPRVAFCEVTPRLGGSDGEFATVAVAATATCGDQGRWQRVSLALVGAGERPIRARAAEDLLAGAEPTAELLNAAAESAAAKLDPPSDLHAGPEHRRRLARVLTRRALQELTG